MNIFLFILGKYLCVELLVIEWVYVSSILHKAALTLDEKGSEASATTIVGMETATPGYAPQTPHNVFLADHPFYYAIVDKVNGLILFMGKYNGK